MDEIPQRGFVIASVTESELMMAQALCYSIKQSNPKESVTLVTNLDADIVDDVFDTVVPFPFNNTDILSHKMWQMYWATPYEHTIVLDPKSLLNYPMNETWEYLMDHYDLSFMNKMCNFRYEERIVEEEIYEKNKIDYVNPNIIYFKKDTTNALAFFKMYDVYTKNYQLIYKQFLRKEDYDDYLQPELLCSLAISHLGIFDDVVLQDTLFPVIDMQFVIGSELKTEWTKYLNVWLNKENIKMQNFIFNGLMLYHTASFMTEDNVDILKDNYFERTR